MNYVIGGNGFVGGAFCRMFEGRGIPYKSIDIANYSEYVGTECDVLINANGNSKKYLADQDPQREFRETVDSVCRSLHDFKYGTYVLCSTCDVYNSFIDPLLCGEDSVIDPRRQSRYGFHKHLAESLVRREAERHLIIRFGGFVGPNLRKNPIFDILNGGPLWVDPESELQFIHTDDAARIVYGLVELGRVNETFNVCGSGVVRIADVISAAGREVSVQPNAPSVRYNVNIEKLKGIIDVPESQETVLSFVRGRTLKSEAK
jgi:nucleoside-diphosphate-sugar epimerase